MTNPIDLTIWQGREDKEDGDLGLRWHQIVKAHSQKNALPTNGFTLFGFCSDVGVKRNQGRIGAAKAPNQIRKALANLAASERQPTLVDLGNFNTTENNLENKQQQQAQLVENLLKEKNKVMVLGGGHETALGNCLGMLKHFDSVGLINIDAHFDLRKPNPKASSGTPFYELKKFCEAHNKSFNYLCLGIQEQANTKALFSRAKDWNVEFVLAQDIHEDISLAKKKIIALQQQCNAIYLTIDLDGIDSAFAPGVSAVCNNGLLPNQVLSLIDCIQSKNQLQLMDVVEYNPNFDLDNRTAKLAALFIYRAVKNWSTSMPSA